MKFTLIKSIYSNEILPQNRFDMPWERFCKILTVPQVVENKEDVQLISPVEYYSEECMDGEKIKFIDKKKKLQPFTMDIIVPNPFYPFLQKNWG